MTDSSPNLIGYWMPEKKIQKLNWSEFTSVCKNHGFQLVKVDLEKPLDVQGPFVIFLHKLTEIIALANQGDKKSKDVITRIESWIMRNPYMSVLDPLENVQKLLDRYVSYSIVHKSDLFKHGVFTPTFAEITSHNTVETIEVLEKANVQYPFICKPSVAHGSKQAHKMCIIFHEKHLKDCEPPCVAQTFTNHNAVLYKIFIIGSRHYVVERPSLKNFYPNDRDTIFFDSQDISKADSTSTLSILDPGDLNIETVKPDSKRLNEIASTIRKELGLALIGIDVIIENETGKYCIIDINAYPGYDGFPNFFEALVHCIKDTINSTHSTTTTSTDLNCEFSRSQSCDLDQDSGFDTGDSSDERAKKSQYYVLSNPG